MVYTARAPSRDNELFPAAMVCDIPKHGSARGMLSWRIRNPISGMQSVPQECRSHELSLDYLISITIIIAIEQGTSRSTIRSILSNAPAYHITPDKPRSPFPSNRFLERMTTEHIASLVSANAVLYSTHAATSRFVSPSRL